MPDEIEQTNTYGYVREADMTERAQEIFITKKVPELIYTIEKDGSSQMYALPIPTFQRYSGSRTYGVVEHPTTMSNYENQLVKSSSPEYTLTLRLLDTIKVTSITTSGASMVTWSRESVLETLKYLGSKGITFDIVGDDPIYNDLTDLLFVKIDDQKEVGDTHTIDVTITCRKQRFSEVGYALIPEYIIDNMGNQDEGNGLKKGFFEWDSQNEGSWKWMTANIPMKYRKDAGFADDGTAFFRAYMNNNADGKIPIVESNEFRFTPENKLQLRCLVRGYEDVDGNKNTSNKLGRFWLKDNFYFNVKHNTTSKYKNIQILFKKDSTPFNRGERTKEATDFYIYEYKPDDVLFDILSTFAIFLNRGGVVSAVRRTTDAEILSEDMIDAFMYTYPNSGLSTTDLYQLKDTGLLGDIEYTIQGNYKKDQRKVIFKKLQEICRNEGYNSFRYIVDGVLESNETYEKTGNSIILEELPITSDSMMSLMCNAAGFFISITPSLLSKYGTAVSRTQDAYYQAMKKEGWRAYFVKCFDPNSCVTFDIGRERTGQTVPDTYQIDQRCTSFPIVKPDISMEQYVTINGAEYLENITCTLFVYKVGNFLVPVMSPQNISRERLKKWK